MDKRKQAWWIIGGSVAFLGALLISKAVLTPPPVCDPSIKSKTVILLDYSEEVSTQTMDSIIGRAWKMIDGKRPAVPSGFSISACSWQIRVHLKIADT